MSKILQTITDSNDRSIHFLESIAVDLLDHAHKKQVIQGDSFDLKKDDVYDYGCNLSRIATVQRMSRHYLEGLHNLGEITARDINFSMHGRDKPFENKIDMGISLRPFQVDNVISSTFRNLHFTYTTLDKGQGIVKKIYETYKPHFQALVTLSDTASEKIDDDVLYLQEHASIISTVLELYNQRNANPAKRAAMDYMIDAAKDMFGNYYRNNNVEEVLPYIDFSDNAYLTDIIEWGAGMYDPDALTYGYSTDN